MGSDSIGQATPIRKLNSPAGPLYTIDTVTERRYAGWHTFLIAQTLSKTPRSREHGIWLRHRIARALYVTATEQRVVVVRMFVKQTQKTPRREINLALERAREVEP